MPKATTIIAIVAFPIAYHIVALIGVILNDGTPLASNENQNPISRTRDTIRIYLLNLKLYPTNRTMNIAANIGNGIVINLFDSFLICDCYFLTRLLQYLKPFVQCFLLSVERLRKILVIPIASIITEITHNNPGAIYIIPLLIVSRPSVAFA